MHIDWNKKLNNLNYSLSQTTNDIIGTIHELTDNYAPNNKILRSKAEFDISSVKRATFDPGLSGELSQDIYQFR